MKTIFRSCTVKKVSVIYDSSLILVSSGDLNVKSLTIFIALWHQPFYLTYVITFSDKILKFSDLCSLFLIQAHEIIYVYKNHLNSAKNVQT